MKLRCYIYTRYISEIWDMWVTHWSRWPFICVHDWCVHVERQFFYPQSNHSINGREKSPLIAAFAPGSVDNLMFYAKLWEEKSFVFITKTVKLACVMWQDLSIIKLYVQVWQYYIEYRRVGEINWLIDRWIDWLIRVRADQNELTCLVTFEWRLGGQVNWSVNWCQ
jgi:hypothetical protein